MEEIYFINFSVVPLGDFEPLKDIDGAFAHCFVRGDSPQTAMLKSKYSLGRSGWQVHSLENGPIIVREENLPDNDLRNQYDEAQQTGFSGVFIGWSQNEELYTDEPTPFPIPNDLQISKTFERQPHIRRSQTCMHYDWQPCCSDTIEAHSIQKNSALSSIAENGEVYAPSSVLSDLKKSGGRISFQRRKTKSFSTFRGFCSQHDNELFLAIDDHPLEPTAEQAFLYAYRSLCREIFVKKCATENFDFILNGYQGTQAIRSMIEGAREGTDLGCRQLMRHKHLFDETHRNGRFEDIRYVLFVSENQ